MLRVWMVAALASAGIGVCACAGSTVGGEDGSGSTGGATGGSSSQPAASPAQRCETYANTRCKKSLGCYVKVGRLLQKDLKYNVDQCIDGIVDRLPCSAIRSTGAGYDSCLKELNAMACTSWDVEPAQFPNVRLPTSCDDALYF